MKYRFFTFFSLLLVATYINAQSEITGFLGINLNDKAFIAIDKLKKRYSNVEWKNSSICIKDVLFLGAQFNNVVITYKSEKLTEAVFTLTKGDVVFDRPFQDPNSFISAGKNRQTQIANQLMQLFNSFGSTLYSKYGEPVISNQNNVIWKDINSNSITLNMTYNTQQTEYIMSGSGRITVTYRTAAVSDNEF